MSQIYKKTYIPARLRTIAIVLTLLSAGGCASGSARRVLVILDQSLYEVLADVNKAEQQVLCQQNACVQLTPTGGTAVIATPIAPWSLEKSHAFNRELLIAIDAARQFNQLLTNWRPGTPTPEKIHQLVASLALALSQIGSDFPDGSMKTAILTGLSRAEAIVLQALDLFLSTAATMKGTP